MNNQKYVTLKFELLLYFYSLFRNCDVYQKEVFNHYFKDIDENYLINVLRMLNDEGYLKDVKYKRLFANVYMLVSLDSVEITSKGIEFIETVDIYDEKYKKSIREELGNIYNKLIAYSN